MTMIRTFLATALLAASAAADEIEEAGQLFKERCAVCHAVPDRELKGDRAWLGQIPDTA
jgi:mono/diheme cytochrome c family protein